MSEVEWKIATIQAQTSQKVTDQGSTPSDLDRLINEHINPTVPWEDHLREFTSNITRDDYTWTRPNTRYAHTGFILPTLYSESIGDIVIAIDTSGSVNDKLLARFLSESQSLLDSAKPSSITIISCDTTVKNPKTFYAGDTLTDYIPKGGGGTEFDPVFEYIQQSDLDPIALIYFTDGQGYFPNQEPHYPTLWLHYGREVDYPFGIVLNIPPSQAA
jgi:predicted metal-dependent peptidase